MKQIIDLWPWFKLVGACLIAVVLAKVSGLPPSELDLLGNVIGGVLVLAVCYLLVDLLEIAMSGVPHYIWERLPARLTEKVKRLRTLSKTGA